jgi:PKD repeat protein
VSAATNIHDAVALAGNGDLVLVSNGVYRLTNQIVIATGITLRGANGPDATTLYRDASAGNFRLVNISNANAQVSGLTLTNGYLSGANGAAVYLAAGGISNCVIAKCRADGDGMVPVYISGGLMTGCLITNNVGSRGAAYVVGGVMEGCEVVRNAASTYNGGLCLGSTGVARRCRIVRNTGNAYGPGGVWFSYGGRLENSIVYANTSVSAYGGGVRMNGAGSAMENCTVAGNSAPSSLGDGIMREDGTIRNCIVYGNGANAPNDNYYGAASAAWYSCAPELTNSAQSNVTVNPAFVNAANGDFHLALGSPCLDTGTNLVAITNDIDLQVRPLIGYAGSTARHDRGAYEKDGLVGALAVGFSGSPLSGLESVKSIFAASVAGTNTTITWWGWDFDNNGVFDVTGASLATVTNTFGPGRYSISVRVTNSVGEAASSTNLDCVLVVSSNIYVSTNGGNVLPYGSWADAATNVHDAVRVAVAGCTVWITNGSYRLTNQIEIFSPFAVRSVNGPEVTTLWRDASFGNFRLFDIRDTGAAVSGLTLTNGYLNGYHGSAINLSAGTVSNCVVARNSAAGYGFAPVYLSGGLVTGCVISNNNSDMGGAVVGGGILENCTVVTNSGTEAGGCEVTAGGTIRRCRIFRNAAGGYGPGGVFFGYGGRVENSLIYGNTSAAPSSGGGAFMIGSGSVMENCTITANSAPSSLGDGVYRSEGTIRNCIIHGNGNSAPNDNYYGAANAAWYSCAPELTNNAQSNVTVNPKFVNAAGADYHLALGSPCLDTGTNLVNITNDIDLRVRPLAGYAGSAVRHDMGAYEKDGAAGPLDVGFSGSPLSGSGSLQTIFTAFLAGTNTTITWWGWDFDNNGVFDSTGMGFSGVTNTFGPGRYSVSVRVTNSVGETASSTNLSYVLVVSSNIYVSANGGNVLPYGSWADAATNILDAIVVAIPGCTVWITNGSYRLTNTVAVYSGFTVRTVNGPTATTLWRDSAFGNFGLFDIRDPNAWVTGLTLTNGYLTPQSGSAINLSAGTVSDCVITKCRSDALATTPVIISGGLMTGCVISNNVGSYGSVWVSGGAIEDCTIITNSGTGTGGLTVVSGGVVRRCRVLFNRQAVGNYGPGGIFFNYGGRVENSLICGNYSVATTCGGGAYMAGGSMINCTVAGNTAAGNGGGVYQAAGGVVMTNCIIYGNTGAPTNDYAGPVSLVWYSCAPELTAGVQGNVTANPNFRNATGSDYHLRSGSPCINKGIMLPGMTTQIDLDANPRVVGGKVDMGAYEVTFQGSVIMIR